MTTYPRGTNAVTEALQGAFGPDTPRVAKMLTLASCYGAGDALAGLILMKAPRLQTMQFISNHFPAYIHRPHQSTEGVLMGLLGHRTGNPVVDRVLAALDRASSAGGDIEQWLKEQP